MMPIQVLIKGTNVYNIGMYFICIVGANSGTRTVVRLRADTKVESETEEEGGKIYYDGCSQDSDSLGDGSEEDYGRISNDKDSQEVDSLGGGSEKDYGGISNDEDSQEVDSLGDGSEEDYGGISNDEDSQDVDSLGDRSEEDYGRISNDEDSQDVDSLGDESDDEVSQIGQQFSKVLGQADPFPQTWKRPCDSTRTEPVNPKSPEFCRVMYHVRSNRHTPIDVYEVSIL